jgi:hypothetical protein
MPRLSRPTGLESEASACCCLPTDRLGHRAFDRTPAVQHQDLYEIKSSLILQPGPAALTDGLAELQKIIELWATRS